MSKVITIVLAIVFALGMGFQVANASENNAHMKQCIQAAADFNEAASCHHKRLAKQTAEWEQRVHEFVKANPDYRIRSTEW